ncbi:YihY/virulence factor BrkB family protein [Thioalkalivibrio sp. XN8]|uniref:YihY/virulence factor BrkB family protein n=1 Tax=Thioalkalivibrio sp. XN8 TaxID=2712863 RepID=UPI0013E9AF99|nr:YihY/virulence factor BrkB family protein [Thioalkalivibrio sp. XN8]NGP53328.1 YihY/virulence factor BrkB family protein [Thioalkalivibrio sp. XN8]
MIESLRERVEDLLWGPNADSMPTIQRVLLWPARFLYAIVRDLSEAQLTLRSMSLVYTTLLSIVPLLAFSFSVLKGFGVHRQIEPLLYEFLAPLGEKGAEITSQVIDFVENVRGGVLGGIGLALLIFTVISMIQKVEDTFNHIWQVQKSRSFARRFSDYLSVIMVGPILMVTAMGLLATVNSSAAMQAITAVEPFGAIFAGIGRLAPMALVVAVFAFVYTFVPNTSVRLRAAVVGAAVAGAAWTLGGSLFASIVVGSTRYAAIYSSFAIAIIALVWLYLSWLILLLGAQVAFYVQHPGRLRYGQERLQLSISETENLALGIMQAVGQGFRSGPRPGFARLARELECPARALEDITDQLEAAGLLVRTEEDTFMPGREPDQIGVADILAAVRGERGTEARRMAPVLQEARAAESRSLAGRHLGDLLQQPAGSVSGHGHAADENRA